MSFETKTSASQKHRREGDARRCMIIFSCRFYSIKKFDPAVFFVTVPCIDSANYIFSDFIDNAVVKMQRRNFFQFFTIILKFKLSLISYHFISNFGNKKRLSFSYHTCMWIACNCSKSAPQIQYIPVDECKPVYI